MKKYDPGEKKEKAKPGTWISSIYPGVRYREHPTDFHGKKRDRYYAIRYQMNGERKEEGLGWGSEGWTEQKAALELAELKQAAKTGKGHTRLSERREEQQKEKEEKARNALTFNDFFNDEYLPLVKPNKSENSYRNEEALYRNWIKPVIGQLALRDISPLDLERLKKAMRSADPPKSPRTVHYALAVVRQAFNVAHKIEKFTGDNPVGKVKKPSEDNRRLRFLTHDEAKMILDHLKIRSTQMYQVALLSLHTGMRAGEIFKLTWNDIDLHRGLITVRDTKSGRNRKAFMTSEVKAILSNTSMEHRKGLVFKDRNGEQITEVSRTFDRAVEDLGLNEGITDRRDRLVFHSLRHTYASWLVENGTDLYTVKELMGHSTLAMAERYSHLAPNTLQAAVKALDETMKQKAEEARAKQEQEQGQNLA
jgi:integrase